MIRLDTSAALLVLVAAGCVAEPAQDLPAIDAAVIGPVFDRADGPHIECRGLPAERCLEPGTIQDGVGGVALREVDRVVVSCIGSCAASAGAFRVDVVIGATTREVGRGGWGEAR